MATDENELPLSIADIAGVDLNDVKEVRYEALPQILGTFEIIKCDIEMSTGNAKNKPAPMIVLGCKVVEVETIVGDDRPKEEFIDKEQRQSFYVKKAEDIGRFKAFLVDMGMEIGPGSPLDAVCKSIVGHRFPGRIKHRSPKEDPDTIYASVHPIVPPKA